MLRPVIEDIRRRSTQGATQPFLCRSENGQQYWVKGANAGNEALCAEWIAGRLCKLIGLPIPVIEQVVVPEEIIEASAMDGILDLGAGIRFASSHVESAQEYAECFVNQTDETLRQIVLVFDIWIRNTDRTFSRAYGANGNPNLLWGADGNQLWVIDHNNAFLPDDLFAPSEYARHVFTQEKQRLTPDFKAHMLARMKSVSEQLDAVMAEIPDEWKCIATDSDYHRLTLQEVRRIIIMPLKDERTFWERLENVP